MFMLIPFTDGHTVSGYCRNPVELEGFGDRICDAMRGQATTSLKTLPMPSS